MKLSRIFLASTAVLLCLSFAPVAYAGQDKVIHLNEVEAYPNNKKVKVRKIGKSKNRGLFSLFYQERKGSAIGFEVKPRRGKTCFLTSVGFHIAESHDMLSEATFGVKIYRLGKRHKGEMRGAVPETEQILVPYRKEDVVDGKFTYRLPCPVEIPDNSMVAIEVLKDFYPEVIKFRSGIIGKQLWFTSPPETDLWIHLPITTPFFIETAEI